MTYKAKILADSINSVGKRITTMQVDYALSVHAEHLRHRAYSFSVASARAIPTAKIITKLENDPFLPVFWGENQPGMVAEREVGSEAIASAQELILKHRDNTIELMRKLSGLGIHKQTVNRYAAPFQYVTVIVTGTDWQNFWDLRCHKDAQPEIRKIAEMMNALYVSSAPTELPAGAWHIPMAEDRLELLAQGYEINHVCRIAAARIARISYETHDGKRDPSADLVLCDKLESSKHWSPLEHVAVSMDDASYHRNFCGWRQLRAIVDGQG